MSNSRGLAVGLALLGAGAAVGIIACESVPLTAAPGTSMTLIANPTFVIANGGVSVVTAILVEPVGTFVPDGTEVFFFTDLGRVDSSGKTVNGVARVNFVADARSGPRRRRSRRRSPRRAHGRPRAASRSAPAPALRPRRRQGSARPCTDHHRQHPADASPGGRQPAAHHQPAPVRDHRHRLRSVRQPRAERPGRLLAQRQPHRGDPGERRGTAASPTPTGRRGTPCVTKAPVGGVQKTVTVTATTANGIEGSVTVFID